MDLKEIFNAWSIDNTARFWTSLGVVEGAAARGTEGSPIDSG
jgi:hypothetical protein